MINEHKGKEFQAADEQAIDVALQYAGLSGSRANEAAELEPADIFSGHPRPGPYADVSESVAPAEPHLEVVAAVALEPGQLPQSDHWPGNYFRHRRTMRVIPKPTLAVTAIVSPHLRTRAQGSAGRRSPWFRAAVPTSRISIASRFLNSSRPRKRSRQANSASTTRPMASARVARTRPSPR